MRIQVFQRKYQQEVYQFIYHVMIKDVKKEPNKLKIELIPEEDIYKTYILSGGNFWIALNSNNEVIGTIGLKVENKHASLHRFYVSKSYRSCKIGSGLYERLEQYAYDKHVKEIYLSSGRHLKNAHAFYQKHGFEVIDDSDMNCSTRFLKTLKNDK